jgi:hypothetical protein
VLVTEPLVGSSVLDDDDEDNEESRSPPLVVVVVVLPLPPPPYHRHHSPLLPIITTLACVLSAWQHLAASWGRNNVIAWVVEQAAGSYTDDNDDDSNGDRNGFPGAGTGSGRGVTAPHPLLDNRDNDGRTPLMYAIRANRAGESSAIRGRARVGDERGRGTRGPCGSWMALVLTIIRCCMMTS